jgi:hypothetical protein
MRVQVPLDMAPELFVELEAAAKMSHLTPGDFCAQVIQAAIASRRLAQLPPPRCGGRVPGSEEDREDEARVHKALVRSQRAAYLPVRECEPPLLDDLTVLEDLK